MICEHENKGYNFDGVKVCQDCFEMLLRRENRDKIRKLEDKELTAKNGVRRSLLKLRNEKSYTERLKDMR